MLSLQPWLQSLAPGIMIDKYCLYCTILLQKIKICQHTNLGCMILYDVVCVSLCNITNCLVPSQSSWTWFSLTSLVQNSQHMSCMSFTLQQAGSILIAYDPFPNSLLQENIHPFYGACLCFWTRDTSLTSPGPLRPAAPEWSWMCCLANDQRDKFSSLNLEAYRRKIKSLPCLSTDFVAWCGMHLYLPFIYSMIPQADGVSRASN